VEKVRMENAPNILRAAELLDGLKRSVHTTYWSYCDQLERLKLFKRGHDQDTKSWSDHARSNPTDQNLQRLADNGSQGIGYSNQVFTEFEGYLPKYQTLMRFVDDLELQLRIPGARI
jgi:hypothetical protein